jgi:protein TonB
MTTIITLVLVCSALAGKCQSQDTIYTYVDTIPQFEEGDAALLKYLRQNVQYPAISREVDVVGKVIIRFVVNTDGTTSDFVAIRSAYPPLENEFIRVLKSAGRFKPGIKNGKPVRVYITLPVFIHPSTN